MGGGSQREDRVLSAARAFVANYLWISTVSFADGYSRYKHSKAELFAAVLEMDDHSEPPTVED